MNKMNDVLSKKINTALSDLKLACKNYDKYYPNKKSKIVPAASKSDKPRKTVEEKLQIINAEVKERRAIQRTYKRFKNTERLVVFGIIAEHYFQCEGTDAANFDKLLQHLMDNPEFVKILLNGVKQQSLQQPIMTLPVGTDETTAL